MYPTELSDTSYPWFILNTKTGKESLAKQQIELMLAQDGCEHMIKSINLPSINTLEYHGGAAKKRKKKLLPGYLVINMQPDSLLVKKIESLGCVLGFLGQNQPTPITNSEVETILNWTAGKAINENRIASKFQVGSIVNIVSGPFKDFKGSIIAINEEKNECTLDVYILGRPTPVAIKFFDLELEE